MKGLVLAVERMQQRNTELRQMLARDDLPTCADALERRGDLPVVADRIIEELAEYHIPASEFLGRGGSEVGGEALAGGHR